MTQIMDKKHTLQEKAIGSVRNANQPKQSHDVEMKQHTKTQVMAHKTRSTPNRKTDNHQAPTTNTAHIVEMENQTHT